MLNCIIGNILETTLRFSLDRNIGAGTRWTVYLLLSNIASHSGGSVDLAIWERPAALSPVLLLWDKSMYLFCAARRKGYPLRKGRDCILAPFFQSVTMHISCKSDFMGGESHM